MINNTSTRFGKRSEKYFNKIYDSKARRIRWLWLK